MRFIVFADSNVFLDALLMRPAAGAYCERILELAEQKDIRLSTSSSCLINVIYFLHKAGFAKSDVKEIIENLLTFTSIVSPTTTAFLSSLNADFTDLEDAIQYHTALQIKGVDYFLTSNTKDFKKASAALPVSTPKEFLTVFDRK